MPPDSLDPLVSVLMPSFNQERFVREAIDSVLDQEYANVELIVIDDGSTDGSVRSIERHLAARLPAIRVEFESRENHGRSATLNYGLSLARGSFITPLDSDDVLEIGMVRTLMTALRQGARGAGAAFGDGWVIDGNGRRQSRLSDSAPYRGGDVFLDLATLRFIPFMQSSLIRKDMLDDIGAFDERFELLDDWDMWFRLTHRSRVVYVDEPVFRYRFHGENRSVTRLDFVRREATTIVEELLSRESALAPRAKAIRAELTARHGAQLYNALRTAEARRYAIAALRRSPTNRLAWKVLARSLLGARVVERVREARRRRRELTGKR